ncbi:Putative ribonuclease H protein [Dendrobium catenatum]|uniref:Ribonuclease H protein n=1 Tax=Dendrobium catenatum TaxID=906689 RepID=A0A2I0V710_9ASPA|nr:Putative ribonuclease H protein [Dendrobium catenatum]
MYASWITQRAKVNWIKNGEEDLKFLYAKIRTRRGSNNSVANLLTNNSASSRSEVINSLIQFYQGLYNPLPPPNENLNGFPVGVLLPQTHVPRLSSLVQDEEIKFVVFSGSSNSAPGPDGFNFYFYKSAWHIISPSVCRAIKSFFQKCYMPNGVKATTLAIIPKHKNATSISEYRPIALCNVIYKIIAKVLAERMKPVMNLIVKDNQAGFVKSRVSTDNILLANEILFFAGKRRNYNTFCAKLDIKKAFDSVSRKFLLDRLAQKGFPSLFINWIKSCITDVNFSIMLNGALEGFFSSTAGLRQGCPLSPYLFCIVMDAFSNLLESRGFRGISIDNYSLSHLLYADDVLIFGEATLENCNILANSLRDFANFSGLQVNYEKSAIMFLRNQSHIQDICQALTTFNIVNKINYLGIPLSYYRLKIEDYLPLLDKVNKKMNRWKANLLSFAGRLQYIKFTIQNTIAYWIRGSILPKYVNKFLNKSSARFLFFGDTMNAKTLHMISWDRICRPKNKGGLGIPSILAMQFAYICSIRFRMYNCSTPLSKWLLCHYKSPWRPFSVNLVTKTWKLICKTAFEVKHCFNFKITKNAPISLIWDHWLNNETVNDHLGGYSMDDCPDIFLKDLIIGTQWIFPESIPPYLRNLVAGINTIGEEGSCLLWKNRPNYKFKNFIEEFYADYQTCSWHKMVWAKRNILKHSVFVWMALVGGLKTVDALITRNINVPGTCSLCHYHNETVSHLFFECSYTFTILTALFPGMKHFLFRPTIMQVFEWVKGQYKGNAKVKNYFYVTICCAIYHI